VLLRLALAGLTALLAAAPALGALDDGPPLREDPTPPRSPGKRGSLVAVPGSSAVLGRGPGLLLVVEVEGGLRVDRAAFATRVAEILADRRSWGGAIRRVSSGAADLRVALASPGLTDQLCAPLRTNGIFSCVQGGRAVLNAARWRGGADAYGPNRRRYRVYMVNHEVGHLLGRGHSACPASGALAPVMMQQTKGVAPCRANPWPLASERG
jgi:Protein of unknown function (DUF3152)